MEGGEGCARGDVGVGRHVGDVRADDSDDAVVVWSQHTPTPPSERTAGNTQNAPQQNLQAHPRLGIAWTLNPEP